MGISLKALIENPKKLEDLKLSTSITGKRPTLKGYACDDCYYEQLGKLVEQHPIVTARVRRG